MSDSMNICPICGEGQLLSRVGKNAVEYKGHDAELDLHYCVCDTCGSEQTDAVQLRDNKRAMIAFKKQIDGLLSGAEVRALREQLGISQAEAAKIFGGGPVAFSKYESDDVAQSEAMDKLLRLVVAMPMALGYLRRRVGLGINDQDLGQWMTGQMVTTHVEHRVMQVIAASALMPEQEWRKCA